MGLSLAMWANGEMSPALASLWDARATVALASNQVLALPFAICVPLG